MTSGVITVCGTSTVFLEVPPSPSNHSRPYNLENHLHHKKVTEHSGKSTTFSSWADVGIILTPSFISCEASGNYPNCSGSQSLPP